MSHVKNPGEGETRRRRSTVDSTETNTGQDLHKEFQEQWSCCDRLCISHHRPDLVVAETCSLDASNQHFYQYTPKCLAIHRGGLSGPSGKLTSSQYVEEGWQDSTPKTTIRAENEVEANKQANNYKFGFRKWKSHVTERPMEDRSVAVRELYSDLNFIKTQAGSLVTWANIAYVFLFGWWISLTYLLICILMFLTIIGAPYGKLCWKLTCYFIWPFGKSIQKTSSVVRRCCMKFPNCEAILEEVGSEENKDLSVQTETTPLLKPTPTPTLRIEVPLMQGTQTEKRLCYWHHVSTYVWLVLGYPLLVVAHCLACLLAWLLVFTIPVAKMNARTLGTILLLAPEDIHIQPLKKNHHCCEGKVLLCCYHTINWYYYKYTVQGINVLALNLLPLVVVTLVVGYTDREDKYTSAESKFATAITSIIPLSYYIGMGIASISAQSNFAVGAVVNATFGSITEMAFYITALLQGHRAGSKCYEEIVKAALTGTLLGCILFVPGICMIIGGCKHREQRFNSRSAGVSSALLFISIGGVFAPTLFSKAYGNLVCEGCSPANSTGPFVCNNCHYDTSEDNQSLFLSHIEPLVYTISVLLPAAYLIGLIFTLKTHTHIYDIHISDGHNSQGHGGVQHVVHWSRWRALAVLIIATLLMAACADLTTDNIKPILEHSTVSQYFIGVTVLAMVPELPEIVNGIQFALQNNISLSLEVGSCIAVQVCMIQIPLLILFNAFYDVGFVLIFSDLHLWASIFSVIVVNYIFMDGKCDYFQGTALVVVYLILLALYFFAPSATSC